MSAWRESIRKADLSIKTRSEALEKYQVVNGEGYCPYCGGHTLKPWAGGDLGYDCPDDHHRMGLKCGVCNWQSKWYRRDETATKRKSEDLSWVIRERGKVCEGCGLSAAHFPYMKFEVDHIKAVCDGGETSRENLKVLCAFCHNIKTNSRERARKLNEQKHLEARA